MSADAWSLLCIAGLKILFNEMHKHSDRNGANSMFQDASLASSSFASGRLPEPYACNECKRLEFWLKSD